jgi:hypothetical protein
LANSGVAARTLVLEMGDCSAQKDKTATTTIFRPLCSGDRRSHHPPLCISP